MSMTNDPKFLTKTEGNIIIDIPPISLPTPVKAARWLSTSPAVRTLVLVLIGVAIGYNGQHISVPSFIRPAPVIAVTETLTDFVSRETESLTADEREKLIAVTKGILAQQFDTPSAMREEFLFQRLKAGIDSPAFSTFRQNWSAKVKEMKIVESVESVREVYELLLHGLQSVKSYIDFTGEPEMETADDSPQTIAEMTDTRPQTATVQRQRIFRRR